MINKVILLFGILNAAFAIPSQDNPLDSNCINSTKDNEIKINAMVNEIVDFLNVLSGRYDDFDIRSLKLQIDKHHDDEDEKDTVLDITVNYCKNKESTDNKDGNENTDKINADNIQIDVNLKPSVVFLQLPENGEELFSYLKKKRGTRPFLMYINGYKQILLP